MEDVSRSGLIPSLQTPNYKQCKEQVKLVAFLACVNGEESESKLLQLVIRAVFITARAYLTLYMPLGAYGLITNFHFFFFFFLSFYNNDWLYFCKAFTRSSKGSCAFLLYARSMFAWWRRKRISFLHIMAIRATFIIMLKTN